MDSTMRPALEAAAKRLCICDGECFETRHGMMHGPCERRMGETAAAIAAFHEHRAAAAKRIGTARALEEAFRHESIAAAVEAAAKEAMGLGSCPAEYGGKREDCAAWPECACEPMAKEAGE